MIRAELSLPGPMPIQRMPLASAARDIVVADAAPRCRTPLQKCCDVLKVLLRTSNDIRRLLRDAAAEIGEIVGGDLGREVGRLGASFLLGLMSDALLGEEGTPMAPDQIDPIP